MPPKVEYRLTEWGQALCPALDALLTWASQRETEHTEADQVALQEETGSPD
ncbi:winged helix-turn-helix transcriptional regulator [Rhodanobacter sp. A1T4]|uniref:winged helix-turn-helix transcriptional regulator n=1 Tax=Rhodanobacter sp. A1T4 TaxID=2723087 RepID=UPI0031F3027C